MLADEFHCCAGHGDRAVLLELLNHALTARAPAQDEKSCRQMLFVKSGALRHTLRAPASAHFPFTYGKDKNIRDVGMVAASRRSHAGAFDAAWKNSAK
jgi:hypothetical protein